LSAVPADWMRRAMVATVTAPIRFYRLFISPMFAPVCRFEPTCSEYALHAVHIHGPLKGIAMTAKRLSRCHPFTWLGGSSGFDPVPPK
jgi:putative membrane protein insertion efficiency factor